ncbi:MAG: EamA family transporter [Patescibacteria group bacterium]|nr:EamA family transporter [Patescibacteria group bacterium]MDD4303909.1 EamA family transporter [Patescibacteria group bacterium]MDD4695104.1 EamA family transporter [Patescibacteria group bacterium]
MSWFLIAIIAYLIMAFVNIGDKFILGNVVPNSKAYTFFVGCLGMIVFVLAPFYLIWPGIVTFLLNIIIGAMFPLALLLMYKALKDGDTSKVITLIGGSIPIFTIFFSISFFNEKFSVREWIGIILLLIGTLIISWIPNKKTIWHKFAMWFGDTDDDDTKGIIVAILAALFFSLFFIGTKYMYNIQPFMSGFIWIRLGSFIMVLFLLVDKKDREGIFKSIKLLKKTKNKFLFFGNQGLAAVGSFLQNYAIALGSVVFVNALQGVQYAFLLILGAVITMLRPKAIKEDISKSIIIQKAISIFIIAIGLYLIS